MQRVAKHTRAGPVMWWMELSELHCLYNPAAPFLSNHPCKFSQLGKHLATLILSGRPITVWEGELVLLSHDYNSQSNEEVTDLWH